MRTPLETAKLWMDATNGHDLPAMESLYAENVVGLEVADPPAHDKEGLIASYKDLFSAYPDCRGETLNEFEGADQAVIEIRWTGTNTGPFRGAPPTQAVSDVRIAYIFRVSGDKIVGITEYYDTAQV